MSRAVFQSTLGGSTTLDAEQTADTKTLVIPAADGTLVYTDDAGVASFDDISLTGAVIAGAWDGDTIDVAHGGTGAVTLTGYVKGTGTTAMTASATIPNSDITGLGTMSTQNASAVAITGGTISGLGTPLAVPSGGSGAATLTGYVKGNGTSAMTASATIPNTDISGLGTMSVQNANNVAITGGTISGLGTALAVPSGGTGATTLTGYVKGAGTSAMTASATIPNTDITGLGNMSVQDSDSVTITGGTANGLTIGGSTPAAVTATTLRVNSTISLAGNTGTAGQILTSNGGSAPTWTSVAGVGTVTSVDGSGGTTGLSLTGGPITASGTLTLGGTLAVANGGTGSTTAPDALTALGAYPAANPSGFTSNAGTVTSVGGTGTVNGLSLTGTVTTSGSLTLGGTLDLASPPAIGGTTPAAGAFTTLTMNGGALSPQTGFKNRIINGGMTIDQRNAGASVTVNTGGDTYGVDRWLGGGTLTDGVFTMQQDSSAPVGFSNSLKVTVTTADTSVTGAQSYQIQQKIEGFNFADLGWGTASAQTVTLSFWVRSSLTGTFGGALVNSAFNRSYPFTYTISAANTWEQKSITVAGDTSGTWIGATNGIGLRVYFGLGAADRAGTAGVWAGSGFVTATGAVSVIGTVSATWFITGVQLEKGSVATPFEFRSIGTELGLCQRYYYEIQPNQTSQPLAFGTNSSATLCRAAIMFPVEMRIAPTALGQSGTANQYQVTQFGISSITCSAVPIFGLSNTRFSVVTAQVASGLTQFNPSTLSTDATNGANAYLGFSAEL